MEAASTVTLGRTDQEISQNSLLRLYYRVAIWIIVIFCSNAWFWPTDSEIAIGDGKIFGALLDAIYFGLIFISIVLGDFKRYFLYVPRQDIIITILLFLIACSCIWSGNRIYSARQLIELVFIFVTVSNVTYRFGLKWLISNIYTCCSVILSLSVLLAILAPQYGVMAGVHQDRWRGLFHHKNNFGEFVAFLFLISFYSNNGKNLRKFYKLLIIFLCLVSIFFIGSSTSLALLAIGLSVYTAILAMKIWNVKPITFFILVLCAGFFIYYIRDALLLVVVDELGRDLTFSYRTTVWAYFYDVIWQRPWTGFGYEYYPTDDSLMAIARQQLFATVRSPHNGYLLLGLGAGFPAIFVLFVWYANNLAALARMALRRDNVALVGFIILLCYFIFGWFESAGGFSPSLGLLMVSAFCPSNLKLNVLHTEKR